MEDIELKPVEDQEREEEENFSSVFTPTPNEETSFSTPDEFPDGRRINTQRDQIMMDKTIALAEALGIENPNIDSLTLSNYFKTQQTPDGTGVKLFYIKNGEPVDLTQKNSGKFYASSTIRSIIGIGKIR